MECCHEYVTYCGIRRFLEEEPHFHIHALVHVIEHHHTGELNLYNAFMNIVTFETVLILIKTL